jgi:hypothetical protein
VTELKIRPSYLLSTRDNTSLVKTQTKASEWKMIHKAKRNQKLAGVAILTSNKVGFKSKLEEINRAVHTNKRNNPKR